MIQKSLKYLGFENDFYVQVFDSDERGIVQNFEDAIESWGEKYEQVESLTHEFSDGMRKCFTEKGYKCTDMSDIENMLLSK